MSAQVGYVGHHATHLVTPTEGNQALPGVGDPATWAPEEHAPAALRGAAARHHDRDHDVALGQQVQLAAGEHPPARVEGPRVPGLLHARQGDDEQPRLLRRVRRHRSPGRHSATEGAYWQNTYDPEAEWGPMFHDVRHNFIFSADLRAALRQGPQVGLRLVRRRRTRSSAAGSSAASSRRAPAFPSPSPTAATARCRASAARSGRTASAIPSTGPTSRSTSWLDINAFAGRGPRARSATARIGVARAPGYVNVDLVLSKRFEVGGARYLEFRVEAFNAVNHSELRAARARHLGAQHVRPDHEHDQLAARGRAGVEVLLLTLQGRSRGGGQKPPARPATFGLATGSGLESCQSPGTSTIQDLTPFVRAESAIPDRATSPSGARPPTRRPPNGRGRAAPAG